MPGAPTKEFIVVDESGDPGGGAGASLIYALVALHADEATLYEVREHLTAFRYHTGSSKEFKDSRWAKRPLTKGNALEKLLDPIVSMVAHGDVTVTAVWLNKATYRSNKGPYLTGAQGDTTKFRHFQLRRLLECHRAARTWGSATDLVIDRWAMTEAQRLDLETYLCGNIRLRPTPWITLVDSAYCDPVQLVDIISRLVTRIAGGTANADEIALGSALASITEFQGGLYN